MATFEDFYQGLVDEVVAALSEHQVPDYGSACRCGKKIHNGEPGSMTLTRHRAERIVNDIFLPQADTISRMVSDKGVH